MKNKHKNEYRKAKKSPLRKDYFNHKKVQGGCKYNWMCCFPDYGLPRGENKQRIRRHLRRVIKQEVTEEINSILEEI